VPAGTLKLNPEKLAELTSSATPSAAVASSCSVTMSSASEKLKIRFVVMS